MKSTNWTAALVAVAIAIPATVFAQDDEAIDNVVVVGEKSLSQLRNDLFSAEEDFYALYNELNDEDEYDVTCFYETPTGTRIKNHVCRAKFIAAGYAREASRRRMDVSRVANQDSDAAMAEKTARFQEKLETLITANPELQTALARYNNARAQFDVRNN